MTSCQKLAKRYASESGNAIPASSASVEVRNAWLLTSEWGCIPPGDTEFKTAKECETLNDAPPPASPKSSLATRPPKLNFYKQEGFLSWVNKRGSQCVNKVVGNFFGFDTTTGQSKSPSPTQKFPNSQCWGMCYSYDSDSDMCFECVKSTVLKDPTLCPELDLTNPANDDLLKDSVNCLECAGKQSSVPITSVDRARSETQNLNQVWQCITSTVSDTINTADIVAIVIGCVFVVTIVIVLGVYYGYFKPKLKKLAARTARLERAGINIDSL